MDVARGSLCVGRNGIAWRINLNTRPKDRMLVYKLIIVYNISSIQSRAGFPYFYHELFVLTGVKCAFRLGHEQTKRWITGNIIRSLFIFA